MATHGFNNGRLKLHNPSTDYWINYNDNTRDFSDFYGSGSPEGVVSANISSTYRDYDTGEMYTKTTDTVNTGWSRFASDGGDVEGPASSVDNSIARYDGTTGKLIQSSNVTIDDSDNVLIPGKVAAGTGNTASLDTLDVLGSMNVDHTSTENDDYAFKITCDCNTFSDVKALNINYITNDVAAGEEEEVILVNIDETASTGGTISGYIVLSTATGSAEVNGYTTGINVNPIVQEAGTFVNADSILNKAVDVTAALASGGAGNISIFVADNDTFTIGDASKFDEMEIILDTGASGAGVAPTFEYSTGGASYSTFVPADGTNGFRNTGSIFWLSSDLSGWATATSGNYEIRITRTRNILTTTPIIDELQIVSPSEFKWDKNGDVNLNSLTLSTDLAVTEGGTGASTLTDGGILLGSGTSAITALGQATNGQLPIGNSGSDPTLATLTAGTGISISNGSGSITINSTGSGSTWNEVTGTSQGAAVDNGYIANNASLVTVTLPASASIGETVKVIGKGAGKWKVGQNAGQTIYLEGSATTTGTGGSIAATNQYDSIELICTTANSGWAVANYTGTMVVV